MSGDLFNSYAFSIGLGFGFGLMGSAMIMVAIAELVKHFRPASAIEARRAETHSGSGADESAVPNGETPQ